MGLLKSQFRQRIWTSSPLLSWRVPVICKFYPADGRGPAIPSARKLTGYIPLCCNLCGM